jgi:hypothetical protein
MDLVSFGDRRQSHITSPAVSRDHSATCDALHALLKEGVGRAEELQ